MQSLWNWALPGIALVLIVLLYFRFRQVPAARDDRYTSEALMTPAQADLLHYLQTAFPGQAVLPNVPLNKIVSIRRAADRRRARQTLDAMQVNFVVCDNGGKAAFVVDVEAYRTGDASAALRDAAEKNRILKSAGVRLIYVKDSTRKMPSPDVFREKLSLAAVSRVDRASPFSVRQDLEQRLAMADSEFKVSEFKDSDVMGMSRLMDLGSDGQDASIDPWAGGGKRPA